MIVLDEQLLGYGLRELIGRWYRGSVIDIIELRPASRVLDDAIPTLLRTVRDLFTPDVDKLIVDSKGEHERLIKFVNAFMPEFISKIEHYQEREPIFEGADCITSWGRSRTPFGMVSRPMSCAISVVFSMLRPKNATLRPYSCRRTVVNGLPTPLRADMDHPKWRNAPFLPPQSATGDHKSSFSFMYL